MMTDDRYYMSSCSITIDRQCESDGIPMERMERTLPITFQVESNSTPGQKTQKRSSKRMRFEIGFDMKGRSMIVKRTSGYFKGTCGHCCTAIYSLHYLIHEISMGLVAE